MLYIVPRRHSPGEHREEPRQRDRTGPQQHRRGAGHPRHVDDDDPGDIEGIADQRPQFHRQDLRPRPDQPARVHHGPRAHHRREDEHTANHGLRRPPTGDHSQARFDRQEHRNIRADPAWILPQQSGPHGVKQLRRQIAQQSAEHNDAVGPRRQHSLYRFWPPTQHSACSTLHGLLYHRRSILPSLANSNCDTPLPTAPNNDIAQTTAHHQ